MATSTPTPTTAGSANANANLNVKRKLQEVLDGPMPEFKPNADSDASSSSSSMATRILDCHNILGECILYDDRTNEVVWEDIEGKQLHRLDLSTGDHTFHQYDKKLCAFALLEHEHGNKHEHGHEHGHGYLFAWEDGFQLYDVMNDKPLSPMSDGEDVNPKKLPTRLNDGRVDPTGRRFICGGFYGDIDDNYMKVFKCEMNMDMDMNMNMVDNNNNNNNNSGGELPFRLKHEPIVEKIQVTNSICWSIDGNTMYLADSPTQTIFKHDYDQKEGVVLSNNRQIVRKYDVGVPDGSCTDANGNIWNAVWRNGEGRSMVRCIDPLSGEVIHTVNLPDNTSQLTCCCFGGPNLDVLFISSARIHLDREKEPHAGAVYAVKVGVKGRPEKRFGWMKENE